MVKIGTGEPFMTMTEKKKKRRRQWGHHFRPLDLYTQELILGNVTFIVET